MAVAPNFSHNGMSMVVAVEGLDSIDFANVPEKVKRFAVAAVNTTARRYRTESSRRIRDQISFPARYLDSATDGNLRLARTATVAAMEAVIQGRFEPTQLSRFVKGPKRHGIKGPTVEVGRGNRERMNRAFLMNLRGGNIGLVVRLRQGEHIENKSRMVSMNNNLYLLYGPSVNQVFRQVSEEVSDEAGEFMEREFLRMTEALL